MRQFFECSLFLLIGSFGFEEAFYCDIAPLFCDKHLPDMKFPLCFFAHLNLPQLFHEPLHAEVQQTIQVHFPAIDAGVESFLLKEQVE